MRARARRREKREREEKALSRSFSLSISTASPAFHGHESIPRDRRRVGRSSLSTSSRRSLHSCTITRRVDFSSRTGAYLCVFSPSPSSSSSSSSSLSLSLSFVVPSFLHHSTATEEHARKSTLRGGCARSCCIILDGRVPCGAIDTIDASGRSGARSRIEAVYSGGRW